MNTRKGTASRQSLQSVEKPGYALSGNRVPFVFRTEKAEKQETKMVIPFPCCQLFQVHGSKLKLHPVCHLGQASVLRITHRVFLFGVRKDPFNGLFTFPVKLLVLRCISLMICVMSWQSTCPAASSVQISFIYRHLTVSKPLDFAIRDAPISNLVSGIVGFCSEFAVLFSAENK